MDNELYALLYGVAHGYIRKPEQVLTILREARTALDVDYLNECVALLRFARGAFIEDWPEGGVHPMKEEKETEYPDRVKT